MITEEKKKQAVLLLQKKAEEIGRIPKKDDFDDITVARIKAYLGPWPRALEYAGLKEAKEKPPQSKKRKSKSQRLKGLKNLERNAIKKRQKNKENNNEKDFINFACIINSHQFV